MFDSLAVLDNVRLNFSPESMVFLNITLGFIMFGVALEIKVQQFVDLFRNPRSLIFGLISQFVLLPMVTLILVLLLSPPPSIGLGMILVACCPGGNISNYISAVSKANVALSVSLTAIGTVIAIILTPLNFSIWGNLYYQAASIIKPIELDVLQMFKTVFILLGIPMVCGIFINYKFPRFTQRIIKPIKTGSLIVFVCFILAAFYANKQYITGDFYLIFILVLIHNGLAYFTGYSTGKIARLPRRDVYTVSIETGIQNSGLALALIFNPKLFDGIGGMAFIAAWWGVWHMVSGLGLAFWWSHQSKKIECQNV
jgi:bile acid:Na+ symporter, BASS family